MAVLLPMGIEPVRRQSPNRSTWNKIFGSYLFVNPEKIRLRRTAKIGEVRTMAGTVFQPWTNMPDEISLEGVLYGFRAFHEFNVLEDAINSDPQYKEVNFIYKYRRYPGFIKDISIAADASQPRVFSYTINFVSKNAVELHRMLIGQVDTISAELSFADGQISGVLNTFLDPNGNLKLDNTLNAAVIGAMGMGGASSSDLVGDVVKRTAALAAVFAIKFLRKKKGISSHSASAGGAF
jgi:hypothetical protein